MEENRYIDVLFKKPNRNPKKVTIENTLEAMQKLVGGRIEILQTDDVLLVCNEEGKINNLEPNVVFRNDIIWGSFFIAGDDYENADFISISKKQYRKFARQFAKKIQNEKLNEDLECGEI